MGIALGYTYNSIAEQEIGVLSSKRQTRRRSPGDGASVSIPQTVQTSIRYESQVYMRCWGQQLKRVACWGFWRENAYEAFSYRNRLAYSCIVLHRGRTR
jgi:hypothetical protein